MGRYCPRRPMNRRHAADEPVHHHNGLPPEVFDRIVQAVPMQAAAERYGLNPDRRGWCCCPFHSEKTPSFKVYPGAGGFYCFGCGAGGDVLTFAEQLFGLKPVDAARRLDADLALACLLPQPRQIPAGSGVRRSGKPQRHGGNSVPGPLPAA